MKPVLAALCLWLALAPAALAAGRVALLIGNSNYQSVGQLQNPANDATDLAAALERIGFTVTLAIDVDGAEMRAALKRFRGEAEGADMALVYFAGHGIEIEKQNYLIPIDATLETDSDVLFDTIPIDLITTAVSGATTLRMVLLDACRNNPFLGQIKVADAGRSLGRGLGAFEPIGGTLVAFAAKGGTIALDGSGRNSPFMEGVLAHIEEPGLDVSLLFRKVRDHVLLATGNRQEPFTYGSLPGREIYLVEPEQRVAEPEAPSSPDAPPATAQEEFAWSLVKDSSDRMQLQEFIFSFPRGAHVEEAIERMRALPADVAALPPATPAAPVAPDRRTLVLSIQRELERAGCNPGPVDGDWGNRSQEAAMAFARNAGLAVATLEPSTDLLDMLRSRGGLICVAVPAEPEPPVQVAALTACTVLSVTATALDPHGEEWDWAINGAPPPDILIAELGTGTRMRCDDSFSCEMRLSPAPETLSLKIVDHDRVSPNQTMGEGECELGGTCSFPNASVSMSAC